MLAQQPQQFAVTSHEKRQRQTRSLRFAAIGGVSVKAKSFRIVSWRGAF